MLNRIVKENELKQSYVNLGKNDAKLGRDIKEIQDYINSESKSFIKQFLADIRSNLQMINNSIKQLNLDIIKNERDLKILEADISQNRGPGFFNIFLMFIIPAVIYVVGDIMFSKELIVQGWGLGNSTIFETWGLALAIGVAPFLVKYIFEKFINPYLESDSLKIRRFLTGLYIFLGVLIVAAFLQVGYLRGILYKVTKVTIEGNIYDTLYALHPHLMVWSFVVVAMMFIIGGGVLLSIGPKQLSAWFVKRKNLKLFNKIYRENQILYDHLNQLLGEQVYINHLNCQDDQIQQESKDLSNILNYYYRTGYYTYLDDRKIENNESLEKLGLAEYMRVALDKMAKNEKITSRGIS